MIKKEDLEKRIIYTLKKPTTFQGNTFTLADVDAGVELELTEEQASALKEHGIIERKED